MNKALLLLSILFFGIWNAQQIQWMTMNDALKAQKNQPKKIFMNVYASWCGVCKQMDKTVFTHPEVVQYINTHYYPVKFNGEGKEKIYYKGRDFHASNQKNTKFHEFFLYLGLNGFPSTVFFDAHGNVLTAFTGAMETKELMPYLQFFSTDEYKKIKTAEDWEKYQKKLQLKTLK